MVGDRRTVTNVERSLGLREQTSEGKPVVAGPAEPRNVGIATNVNPFLAPIPPNDGNWTVTGINGFQDDVTIHAISLHMHLRGKDVTYLLTYPDGREEVLLRVPNYNFEWQLPYEFAEPIKVPAGSTVKAIARYDNSTRNRMNPAPNKEVYWSEQSWDDMFLTSVRYTVDKATSAARRPGRGSSRCETAETQRAASRAPFATAVLRQRGAVRLGASTLRRSAAARPCRRSRGRRRSDRRLRRAAGAATPKRGG